MLNCDSRALLNNADSQLPMFMVVNDMRFSHIDQDLHIKWAVKKNIRLNQQKKLLVLLRGVPVLRALKKAGGGGSIPSLHAYAYTQRYLNPGSLPKE